ncbi:MAG: isochorismatase family protein [Alphaproteobacteria bacterium]|nr:isochorismatase family protein [Alphaproteobacteria bacterium]
MTKTIETVHLAIDIQNNFFHAPYWVEYGFEEFKSNELTLLTGLKALGIPTLQIIHVEPSSDTWGKQSGHNVPMDFMPTDLDGLFEKQIHNALTDSGLHEWLQAHNVRNVIISGIRTEQCCETTTRVASDFGFHVDYVTEATLTFPMTHQVSGETYPASDIKLKTELVLQGRFADIHTVESLLEKYAK